MLPYKIRFKLIWVKISFNLMDYNTVPVTHPFYAKLGINSIPYEATTSAWRLADFSDCLHLSLKAEKFIRVYICWLI